MKTGNRWVLIIGSDAECCSRLSSALKSGDLVTTVVLNYKEGLERLLYEKPDLAVIELIYTGLGSPLIEKITSSGVYEVVTTDGANSSSRWPAPGRRPVFVVEKEDDVDEVLRMVEDYLPRSRSRFTIPEGSLSGRLHGPYFPRLLADLWGEKATGVLRVHSTATLIVYIVDGMLAYAEGGDLDTALGRMLLAQGRITEEQYDKAVQKGAEYGLKMGYVLIEMGLMTPHELSELLKRQVEEKIVRGFKYTDGVFSFVATNHKFLDAAVSYRLPPLPVLHEGVRRFLDLDTLRNILIPSPAPEPSRLYIDSRFEEDVYSAGLTPKQLRFVQHLTDGAEVGGVVAGSQLGEFETLNLLYFLSLTGYLNVPAAAEVEASFWEPLPEEEAAELRGTPHVETGATAVAGAGGSGVAGGEGFAAGGFQVAENVMGTASHAHSGEAPPGADESEVELGIDHSRLDPPPGATPEELNFEIISFPGDGGDSAFSSAPRPEAGDADVSGGRAAASAAGEAEWDQDLDREIVEIMRSEQAGRSQETAATAGSSAGGAEAVDVGSAGAGREGLTPEQLKLVEEIERLHPRLEEIGHYEILGLPRDAVIDDIKSSYFVLAKKFHPDRNTFLEGELRDKAKDIFVRLSKAYEVLSNPTQRELYDSKLTPDDLQEQVKGLFEAESAFKEGVVHLRNRRYDLAVEQFEKALELKPDEGEYLAYLTWARFLSAPRKDAVLDDVLGELERAVEMNPNCADTHYFLGCVYKHKDDLRAAERNFTRAVECDPNFIEAKRELWLLRKRGSEKKKKHRSFFASLFKR